MSLRDFDDRFGIQTTLEEEKAKFINRIENSIFNLLDRDSSKYEQIFISVCYHLGIDAEARINRILGKIVPKLNSLSEKDFLNTLRVAVALYQSITDLPNTQKIISYRISDALSLSHINLGVKWSDGTFYPSGEEILDKELIEESLKVLEKFPAEKVDMQNALKNYYSKSSYGVVENCYLCLEGLCRQILSNRETLINNKPNLLRFLNFSEHWKRILASFIDYANDYRRHASENRHDLKEAEIESFLYLTCLIIRVTARTSQNNH